MDRGSTNQSTQHAQMKCEQLTTYACQEILQYSNLTCSLCWMY